MPYTTPSTVTSSDVLTAALWNTQIRDNLETLRKPTMAITALGASVTVASETDTAFQLAVTSDPYSMVTTGVTSATYANAGKITVPTTGIYRVSYLFTVSSMAPVTGLSFGGVIKNGVGTIGGTINPTCFLRTFGANFHASLDYPATQSASGLMVLAANDYLQLGMYARRTGGSSYNAGVNQSNFSVELIGTT